jgi:hypothetical protein
MVRAIIFIKGKNWVDTKAKLEQIHETSGSFFTEHCAVMEFYIEAFGNPDFIVSLWSTNIELLKSAILHIRDFCDVDTTSIIGVDPDERTQREKEVASGAPENHTVRIEEIKTEYIDKQKKRLELL